MRKTLIILFITVSAVLTAGTAEVPPAFLRSDAPALQVDISIQPVTEDEFQLLRRVTPGMYRCSVRVHNATGSRRVWGTKDIVLLPGERGEETATLGPLKLSFAASIDERREKVEALVTVFRDDQVISRQRSSISLSAPKALGR